jgi:predicted DsbA family dithiol-disulfide isomerase
LAAVRLHAIMPELQERATLRIRPFPLELIDGASAPRDILEQEWWLAAIQEPTANFAPYQSDDWPTTTLPAFEAAWCAARQGEEAHTAYDLRVRHAFFAEGRNIGRWDVLREIAARLGWIATDSTTTSLAPKHCLPWWRKHASGGSATGYEAPRR